jgi:fumarylpyruvate hydrolase
VRASPPFFHRAGREPAAQGNPADETPLLGVVVEKGELMLSVNGKVRQQSDLSKLIWNISERRTGRLRRLE